MRSFFLKASCLLAVVLTGCGEDPPTRPPAGQPGIRPVLGASIADTVDALSAQALVVEVRDPEGRLASGVVVRFTAEQPRDTTRRTEPALFVCSLSAPTCGPTTPSPFIADTTDADGRAKILVRLGHVVGPAVLKLSAPEFGLIDSVTFTVRPGAAVRVRAVATNLSLDVGGSASVRARVVDRYENSRPETPTLTLGPGTSVTLDATTGVATGREMGTQFVFARHALFVDSTSVGVTPAGRLVVWSSGERVVRLVDLNGSNVRTLATSIHSDMGAFPRFDATRQRVAFHTGAPPFGGGSPNTIVIADTTGLQQRAVSLAEFFNVIVAVRQVADGSLLVVGYRPTLGQYSLARVSADNTTTFIASLTGFFTTYGGADISHDGTRVAYVVGAELRVLNVQSGAVSVLEGNARLPRWSMQGDRVAYLVPSAGSFSDLEGTVVVVNADGTGRRVVGNAVVSSGLAWSPDGVYLIGRSTVFPPGSAMRLFRVSDGNSVLLQFRNPNGAFADYWQADWR